MLQGLPVPLLLALKYLCGIFSQCNAWTCTLKWSLVSQEGSLCLQEWQRFVSARPSPGQGTGDWSESTWPCVLTWLDMDANSVAGRGSGWNGGSWSLHFTIFPLPIFPPARCSVCVESRGCQVMVRTNPAWWEGEGAGNTRKEPAGAEIPPASPVLTLLQKKFPCTRDHVARRKLFKERFWATRKILNSPDSYANFWWNSRWNVLHVRLFSGIVYFTLFA